MKKSLLVILFLVLAGSVFGYSRVTSVFAQDDTTDQEEVDDLEDKIKKYEGKISDLQKKEKSLSNEIEYMNSQISLTELRIQSSISKIAKKTEEIVKLGGDIKDLGVRIEKLQESMDFQHTALNARLRERYKTQENSPVVIIFGSEAINTLIQKMEYLKFMEIQDKKLLAEMDKTKRAYERQKGLFEEKKLEEELLKRELENEKANLDAQKGKLEDQKEERKRLLAVTQNDEQKYQKLLEEARKELMQITNAVGVLKNQTAKEVEEGELIGIQGSSGYSFGDHLHFGVYKYKSFQEIDGWNWYYSNYVDPSKVLESKTVYWDTGCEGARSKKTGSGKWEWPMSSPTISQGFGHTCWSDVYYGGKVHPAYDMYGPSGSAVYAVADGDAYFCRNCLGDGGNGVFIFHKDGYMTVYWHLR